MSLEKLVLLVIILVCLGWISLIIAGESSR